MTTSKETTNVRKRNERSSSYYSYWLYVTWGQFRGGGRNGFSEIISFGSTKVLSRQLAWKRRGMWGTEYSVDGTRQMMLLEVVQGDYSGTGAGTNAHFPFKVRIA